jgi:hypothetical protein
MKKYVVAVMAIVAMLLAGGYVAANAGPSDVPSSPAGNYHSLATPQRLLDTRTPAAQTLSSGASLNVTVAGKVGVPVDATAVVLNVTVADSTIGGYLSVVPSGVDPTGTSTVNWPSAGALLSNQATVDLPANGNVTVYNRAGDTDVVLDVVGYFTPAEAAGTGPAGPAGPQGAKGDTGPAGPQGAPAVNTFGVGQLWINTKFGLTQWAQYETTEAGAPGGDQASGEFRFTCTLTDGCDLSLKAYSTGDGYTVYPRIVLEKEDNTTGAKLTCEYADGTNNEGGTQDLTDTAATVLMGIGSTADCGSTVQTGTPADGVDHINVPGSTGQGIHYDANITLTFAKAAA